MTDTRVSISRSSSAASVNSDIDPPPPTSKPKRERNALSQRFTKLSLFGRKRGKDPHSPPSALAEYIQQDHSPPHTEQQDTSSSMCDEEATTILWEDDGNVKAATHVMLIRRITDEKFVDSNLLTDVIVSYLFNHMRPASYIHDNEYISFFFKPQSIFRTVNPSL
jgi:hypothetical protein